MSRPVPAAATTEKHPLDRVLTLSPVGDGSLSGTAQPYYWNLVGPFGGATAALMLNSILISPDRQGDPIALTINYAAPLAQAEFRVTRLPYAPPGAPSTGTFSSPRMPKRLRLRRRCLACGGNPGITAKIAMPAELPDASSTSALDRAAPMPWFKNYDLRPIRGMGSTRDPQVHTHAWIRDEPARALDFPALTAICDTVMPWMFRRRKENVPVSTVSLSVYFHVGTEELSRVGTEHVYTRSYGQICHGGFMDSNAQVWSRSGILLATTQQMMWVKE